MKYLLILIFATLPFISFGSTPAGWPGNQSGADVYQTGSLELRANVISFKNNSNLYYMAFEANNAGTATPFIDVSHETFLISADDKATVAAIYTAFSTKSKFLIQYKKQTFMGRNVLEVVSFFLLK